MISIDLHPNLASVCPLVSVHCLTLYLNNQTAHNWLFVALIKRGGGALGWRGASFLFAVIKHIPSLLAAEEKNELGSLNRVAFPSHYPSTNYSPSHRRRLVSWWSIGCQLKEKGPFRRSRHVLKMCHVWAGSNPLVHKIHLKFLFFILRSDKRTSNHSCTDKRAAKTPPSSPTLWKRWNTAAISAWHRRWRMKKIKTRLDYDLQRENKIC